jgi:hypothetical protein
MRYYYQDLVEDRINNIYLHNAFYSITSLANSIPSTISYYGKLLRPALTENKKSSAIAAVSTLGYMGVAYLEFLYSTQIMQDIRAFRNTFSSFSNSRSTTEFCDKLPVSNLDCIKYPAGALSNSLSTGRFAFIGFISLWLARDFLMYVVKESLTYSMRAALIRKWLGTSNNNQLGLKIVDYDGSVAVRETIDEYSRDFINGTIRRISGVVDLILACSKAHYIYTSSTALVTAGLTVNLLGITTVALCAYLSTNSFLNYYSKSYSGELQKAQVKFRNNVTFNMENAMQVECLRQMSDFEVGQNGPDNGFAPFVIG